MNNYIDEHQETTKEMYKSINEKLKSKQKTINYNKVRQDPLNKENHCTQ